MYNIHKKDFIEILEKHGKRFAISGDFNAKHTNWDIRNILKKGREFLEVNILCNCEAHLAKKPSYWPLDLEKVSDLFYFFIVKGILASNIFM